MDHGLSLLQILTDILVTCMELDSQRVFIEDKNHNIDTTSGLQITLRVTDSKVISSINRLEDKTVEGETGTFEVSAVTMRENVTIDAYSSIEGADHSEDVLSRRWEIVAALSSIYAQQKQDEHGFKIFKVPNAFINTSAAEGGSQLARYTLSFAAMVCYKKNRLLSQDSNMHYDSFRTRVDDEVSIDTDTGIIELTIDENTEL